MEVLGAIRMLTRIKIRGYKSLEDVEVRLSQLVVLFGPNAAGKSNLLDALQLLSKLGTSRTLKEAFEPPYRGNPLESFTIGQKGIKGLLEQDRLWFSIEADLSLSDAVVASVNRQIQEMRRPNGEAGYRERSKISAPVRERDLHYRIEVEMLPRSGILRVADEYLGALNSKGQPTGSRKAFIERQNERIHLRHEGQAHPTYFNRYLDHSILSMPHYPPHYPHLAAARREFESWLFFYFEPRERMRAPNPVKEVRYIGLMGEYLASFLNTLKATDPRQFESLEKALHLLMPNIDGIEVEASDLGEVELRLNEGGVAIPARVLSEGTLRMLGLLALTGADEAPALVGFEEPENGVHPRRIQLIAELLKTQETLKRTQYIVTTHSPLLLDHFGDESLFAMGHWNGRARIDPIRMWGPLAWRGNVGQAALHARGTLPVSTRILRGDFDA